MKDMVDITFTMRTFALSCLAYGCVAVSASADPIQDQIDALQQRINAVETDTDEMQTSLDIIQADSEENWLSQERALQIQSIVHEVLSDADSRSNLVGDGLLGGWDEGFFIASSDGRFKLKIGGLLQERYITSYLRVGLPTVASGGSNDRWRAGFENTRTRLNISGHIFDRDTTFLIQPGFGWLDPNAFVSAFANQYQTKIESRLWDAWIKFKLGDEWSAKAGVFMLPFTRESLVSDMYQLAVDRSLIDYRLGLARSEGVEFTWVRDNTRAFIALSNGSIALGGLDAGLRSQTPPWAGMGDNVDWSVTSRAEFLLDGNWAQFNQFTSPPGSADAAMFGIAMHAQQGERGGDGIPQDQIGLTADYSVHFDGGTLFASGTIHNQENAVTSSGRMKNVDWVGYVLQGSFYTSHTTEVFMRFEGGGARQNEAGGDDVHIFTTGVNWYLDGQGLKITSDFGWSFGEISTKMQNYMVGWRGSDTRNAEWLFRTQLQLAF
jgi:hypothetical protein